MQKTYTVKQTVVYYAQVTADTEEQALDLADEQGRIELEADAVEAEWEVVA
jgi:hypothetical protein